MAYAYVQKCIRYQPHGCAIPKGWKIVENAQGQLIFVPDPEDK